MKDDTFEELRWRFISRFLDLMILAALGEKPMSGYDFLVLTSKKFYGRMSPGTIYSTLYSMERKGLVEGGNRKRRRVYSLTPKGKETLDNILETKEEILHSLEGILEKMI
jgi:DNA-binding PadR family transcriptional regulator